MREMTEQELASVQDFTIRRGGVGEARWPGRTDMRQVNLDRDVKLEQGYIEVYPNEATKPEVGSKLNKRCEVMLKLGVDMQENFASLKRQFDNWR